jgi:hypothetical protein
METMPGLTFAESFIYQWQYNLLGGHDNAFCKAYCLADEENRGRYWKGFPKKCKALDLYLHSEGWWQGVKQKVADI